MLNDFQITLMIFFVLTAVVLPLLALIDILRNDFKDSNQKLVWVVVVLCFNLIGSILYFVIGTKQKVNKNYKS